MRAFWLMIVVLIISAVSLRLIGNDQRNVARAINAPIVITNVYDPAPTIEPEPEPEPEPEIADPQKSVQTSVIDPENEPHVVADLSVRVLLDEQVEEKNDPDPEVPELDIEQSADVPASVEIAKTDESNEERIVEEDDLPQPIGEIVIDLDRVTTTPQTIDRGYTIEDDGSITLHDGSRITGSGIVSDPFVIGWATLRSVERTYNPRKGRTDLPLWLDELNNKHVRIEGNTLVPVVAQTTRELLVMQNPWDGCCIGIPPTPFDAIEVELDHDVDFGYTSVGYGVVTGTFVVDPYVVDGWVLGVYIIKDASYRSESGTPLPEL